MKKTFIPAKINKVILSCARYMEIFIAAIITCVILVLTAGMICDLMKQPLFSTEASFFTDFLSTALSLVVGVEFVRLLCKHTSETLIEVLMFALARQMVAEHLNTFETLIGIVGIAALFAIRRYLFLTAEQSNRLADKF